MKNVVFCVAMMFVAVTSYAEENDYSAVESTLQTCVACHGEKGKSEINFNPILAGQHFYYVYTQLKDFKEGRRENAIMTPMVSSLDKENMQLISQYFSEQKWPENNYTATKEQLNLARKVIDSGQCVACHLGGFEGDSRVPRLAGQHFEYLEKTMLDFKNKTRKNAAAKGSLFATYSDEEIKAVAAYLSGLKED